MPLFNINDDSICAIEPTSFQAEGIQERADLQRLLRASISVLDDSLMVIAEEFGNWEDSRRRIDLLCIDQDANLVVVEIKRTEDGGSHGPSIHSIRGHDLIDDIPERPSKHMLSISKRTVTRLQTPKTQFFSSSAGKSLKKTTSATMCASSWSRQSSRRKLQVRYSGSTNETSISDVSESSHTNSIASCFWMFSRSCRSQKHPIIKHESKKKQSRSESSQTSTLISQSMISQSMARSTAGSPSEELIYEVVKACLASGASPEGTNH